MMQPITKEEEEEFFKKIQDMIDLYARCLDIALGKLDLTDPEQALALEKWKLHFEEVILAMITIIKSAACKTEEEINAVWELYFETLRKIRTSAREAMVIFSESTGIELDARIRADLKRIKKITKKYFSTYM